MNTNLTRRVLFRTALATPLLTAGLLASDRAGASPRVIAPPDTGTGPFTLPPLPYAYDALEPHIDAQTMTLHHDKHHATYVKNLNDAAAKAPEIAKLSPEQMIQNLATIHESVRMAVRNNAGGHVNHSMFWGLMKPNGGGDPTGPIGDALKAGFGSFDAFKTAFNDAGTKRFGSGWAWLVQGKDGKLAILSTPNQDSPLTDGLYPILGNDVWEHAYYLKYQNRRADCLKAWWNTINWDAVNKRLADAQKP